MSFIYSNCNRSVPTRQSFDDSDSKKLSVKLLIDKSRNRVIFAESDSDFIDTLFSILTLPIGTVAKLIGSVSTEIGSLIRIYRSVSSVESRHFHTDFCKEMLLNPRSASEIESSKLKVRFESSDPVKFYSCSGWSCDRNQLRTFENSRCRKGDLMNQRKFVDEMGVGGDDDGVFVIGGAARFMITDDLRVTDGSTATCISLLRKLGINDGSEVEEKTVEIGEEEVLRLLKFSLLTKSPLTEALLLNQGTGAIRQVGTFEPKKANQDKKAIVANTNSISLKLLISKSRKRVLYAEAGVGVVDFLFSFLTFPLGTIVKLLGGNSSLGCMDELYKSVEKLSNANYIKSEECKKMLVTPKLAPF